MAFTGYFDALSLGLSVKLLLLAISAAFTDSWHPAFYQTNLGPNLALIMALIFTGMLLAIVNLIALCLAVFVTEGARSIAGVMVGACAVAYASVLLVFSCNLASLASPWLLVMLNSSLTALTAHLLLICLKKLENCPLFKLTLAAVMLLMSVLCASLRCWWVADAKVGPTHAATVGLFSLPAGTGSRLVQAFTLLTLVLLVLMSATFLVSLAAKRSWISGDILGEVTATYLGVGLSACCLVFTLVAVIAYCAVTRYTDSLLAAACMSDACLCLVYQLLIRHLPQG